MPNDGNSTAYTRCSRKRVDSIVAVEERKRKFIIRNTKRREIYQVTVDGCFPISSIKCDYLFEVPELNKVFYVELKGSDVNHALEQLMATMQYQFFSSKHTSCEKNCIVVSSRVPQMDPSIQRLIKKCRTQFRATLIIKNQKFEISV